MTGIRLVTWMNHQMGFKISWEEKFHFKYWAWHWESIPFCVKSLLHIGHRNCFWLTEFFETRLGLDEVLDIRRGPEVGTPKELCKLNGPCPDMECNAWWLEGWWWDGCRWLPVMLRPGFTPLEMPAILVLICPKWPSGFPPPRLTPLLDEEPNKCLSDPRRTSELSVFMTILFCRSSWEEERELWEKWASDVGFNLLTERNKV